MNSTKRAETITAPSRRGLLFGASAVAAGAAAVALMPQGEATAVTAQALLPLPEKGGGYQVSEHVKHYYRTTLL